MQGYLSVQEAAVKWGVSERRVKQYCSEGRIPGLIRFGKSWAIPENTLKPRDPRKSPTPIQAAHKETQPIGAPMPLMQSAFAPGQCLQYIDTITDPDKKAITTAEYYYFSAQPEKACKIAELYLTHDDIGLKLSACLIYGFANLSLQHVNLTRHGMACMRNRMMDYCGENLPEQQRAYGLFIYTTASVLFHLPIPDMPTLDEVLPMLPPGLKFFGCYIMAYKSYLDGDYTRSLGITQTALAMSDITYPIPMIYMLLMMAINYMCLKNADKGRECFVKAWEISQRDGFIQPFGEHHGLLHGLIESYLKKEYPKEYESIVAVTYAFAAGWRQVHNPQTGAQVADNLTTTEFSISMLKNRGWSNLEIANHLGFSEQTVKNYVTTIYQKLGISTRKQLEKYMVR